MKPDRDAPVLDECLIVVEEREADQNFARMRIVPTGKRLFENEGCLVVREVRRLLEAHR